jgi:hypothetical protein
MKQQIENVIAAARTVASDATPRCVAELRAALDYLNAATQGTEAV